jgi:hypothetical protein
MEIIIRFVLVIWIISLYSPIAAFWVAVLWLACSFVGSMFAAWRERVAIRKANRKPISRWTWASLALLGSVWVVSTILHVMGILG